MTKIIWSWALPIRYESNISLKRSSILNEESANANKTY